MKVILKVREEYHAALYMVEANYVCFNADNERVKIYGLEYDLTFKKADIVEMKIDGELITEEFWNQVPKKPVKHNE